MNTPPVRSSALARPPTRKRETAIYPPSRREITFVAGCRQERGICYRRDCLIPPPSLLYPIIAQLPPLAQTYAISRRAARAWPFRPLHRRVQRHAIDPYA